jgi:hypothetical protein
MRRVKATRRFLSPVVASVLVTASGAASAAPATLVDRSALGAVANGTVSAGEYSSAGSTGINAGFGNVIGSGTTYAVEADVLGALTFGLSGSAAASCSFNDVVVIYLDTRAGGFATTAGFTDAADKHRAAISGMSIGGPGRLSHDARLSAEFFILCLWPFASCSLPSSTLVFSRPRFPAFQFSQLPPNLLLPKLWPPIAVSHHKLTWSVELLMVSVQGSTKGRTVISCRRLDVDFLKRGTFADLSIHDAIHRTAAGKTETR